eukprot:gene7780-8626_t
MAPEFQPVILAAGGGSRMYPLTEEIPKALLPVGGVPLIWYPIHHLQKYGFEDFIIIVLKSKENMFIQALKSCCDKRVRFTFSTIPDDEDMGTADSLRLLKDKIQTDIIVVSCDVITDAPFHRLADIHRTYDSSLTALIAPRADFSQEKEAGKGSKGKTKEMEQVQKDFIAIEKGENRLLFMLNEADLESENILVRKSLLKRYPNLTIQSNLIDAHMYIMKKWVLDFICEKMSFESVKSDVVPYLIKKQFSKVPNRRDEKLSSSIPSLIEGDAKLDIFSFMKEDELTLLTKEFSIYCDVNRMSSTKNNIRCHGFINDGSLCIRVNNLAGYTHINREITKIFPIVAPNTEFVKIHSTVNVKEKSQVGSDCIVGEGTSISENVSIKKSAIGKHCNIGSKVKISNSIIMEYVTIENGCNVQGSVICSHAYIKENCVLKDCQRTGTKIRIRVVICKHVFLTPCESKSVQSCAIIHCTIPRIRIRSEHRNAGKSPLYHALGRLIRRK